MTSSNNGDRLNRLEAIVESNSRTIQAILDAMAEARLEREELRQATVRTDAAIADINEAIQRLTKERQKACGGAEGQILLPEARAFCRPIQHLNHVIRRLIK
jgi:chromosome segregation ATPase